MNKTKEIRIDGVVEVPSELSVADFLKLLETNSCYFGGSIEEYKDEPTEEELRKFEEWCNENISR